MNDFVEQEFYVVWSFSMLKCQPLWKMLPMNC